VPDGSRILLVDDSQSDLELTRHTLKADPVAARIDVARDGAKALEYIFCAGRHQDRSPFDGPDLVLLDLKQPLIDGFEVLRVVRSDARTTSLPITILSASGGRGTSWRAIAWEPTATSSSLPTSGSLRPPFSC
jgi:two-component system, response regulator